MRYWLLFLFIYGLVVASVAQGYEPPVDQGMDMRDIVSDTVFALKDLESGEELLWGARASDRHPPFSSFKIPNFLIALETGVVSGIDETIPYSPERRPEQSWWPPDWAQDQTLETAFRRSAAWAFQDLALRLDDATYGKYLKEFDYGNQAHRGDAFWLDRSLLISPSEQAHFLERLLTGKLPVSAEHLDALRKVALVKEKSGLRLYGKTGAGPFRDGEFAGVFEGWFVGWLERPNAAPVVFALWTVKGSFEEIKTFRARETQRYLMFLEYLPVDW